MLAGWNDRVGRAVAARALKIERGGVGKNQAQFAEQVVAQGEQPPLDEILGGPRANAAPTLVGDRRAELAGHQPGGAAAFISGEDHRAVGKAGA